MSQDDAAAEAGAELVDEEDSLLELSDLVAVSLLPESLLSLLDGEDAVLDELDERLSVR
ncbi:hypothetical protein ACFFOP_14860 [Sinosporangium siamense]